MKILRKKVIIPIVILIIIFAIVLIMPKLLNFVKEETQSVIDYTVKSFEKNKDEEVNTDDSRETKNNEIQDDLSNKIIDINFGSETVSFNTNYTNEIYEINTLYSDIPVEIQFEEATSEFDDDLHVYVNNKEVANGDSFNVDSITKDNFIEVEFEYNGLKRKYSIQALPSDFPVTQKYKVSKYEGDYYSNFYLPESTYIYKMSNDGEVLYYKRAKGNRSLTNFAKWNIDGKIRYSYFRENSYGKVSINSYSFGDFVVLNENYEVIDTVHSLPTKKIEGNTTEAHDFVMVDDGHYFVMDYVIDNPNQEDVEEDIEINNRVIAGYVQEIKDGDVAWEWQSTDYPEFYKSSLEGNEFSNEEIYAADYIHMNSFFIDPNDGNIIMSLRNLDTVIKVDKSNKEILWRLGGENDDFNLSEEQSPSRQHHATVTEAGNLIIFDNGTKNEQTRILELELDEKNKEVLNFKDYVIKEAFSQFTGSVQKIDEENDVFLIGWGMNRTQPAMMTEIDFKNEEVLTEVVEPEMEIDSYRFMKFE